MMLPAPVRRESNAGYEPFKVSLWYNPGDWFFLPEKLYYASRVTRDDPITCKEVKETLYNRTLKINPLIIDKHVYVFRP